MASKTRTPFPLLESSDSDALPALPNARTEFEATSRRLEQLPRRKRLILFFTTTPRTESGLNSLSEHIRGESSGNRHFVAQPALWNFRSAADILAEAEKCLQTSRFFGFVVSGRMSQQDWPSLEIFVSALSNLGLVKGRVIPILKENVSMPALLRLQEWMDFRDANHFEQSARDLLTLLRDELGTSESAQRLAIGTGSREIAGSAWRTKPLFAGSKESQRTNGL